MLPTHPNFDASFCGKLPLHQTNSIQPHGVLLLVSKRGFKILQVSENVIQLTGKAAPDVINRPFEDFIDKETYELFLLTISSGINGKLPVTFTYINENNAVQAHTVLQEAPDYFMLEVELPQFVATSQNTFINVFQKVKGVISLINAATSVKEVSTIAAKEIKILFGFDKVMIYQFDEDWNGSVIAEEKEEGMDEYLGLKFPASDIPKPARDMYLKNPYRIIPNRDYQPVRLYPVFNPLSHTFTNLFESDLRSVASVHLEYLKNMQVMASMSARIVHNNQLWGLISCHHRTAKYLSIEDASVFELLSNVISSKISSSLYSESFQIKQKLNNTFTQLVENIYEHTDLLPALKSNSHLLMELLNADGVAVCWNNNIETLGTTPKKEDVETLSYWLQEKAASKVYHQPALPHYFDEATHFAVIASGLLALPIQADKRNFLIAFRPEVIRQVFWGGNPDEAVTFEKNSTAYHPRASFNLWQEVVKQTSLPWLEEEVAAAETLRNFIVEHTLNKLN